MKDTVAREMAEKALDTALTNLQLIHRDCPTCKRWTLTTWFHGLFFRDSYYICEICGTMYEIGTEEKITILNPVKRSHKKGGKK